MNSSPASSPLTWTGERMIPYEADPVTEFFHWQRYLYFRPWYLDARVIDAASGEGYGVGFASQFAKSAFGVDLSPVAVEFSARKYPAVEFAVQDVCDIDYSGADLVTSFETIEHLPAPEKFLSALSSCPGRIVISTPNRLNHSPGNALLDRPLNEFHSIEWTPSEFADLIARHFPDRQVRFLSQENRFPGLIREGLSDEAKYCIAVIGDGELPKWPKIGISMPTCDGPQRVQDAIYNLARFYPGELEIAVVANGSNLTTLDALGAMQSAWPHLVRLIQVPENLGYGQGVNRGLAQLQHDESFDLFGVSNDDVIPSIDCLGTMTSALDHLKNQGFNPGCIGPVSNSVNGAQSVRIGDFDNYREMMEAADSYRRTCFSELTHALQVRGLFFLATRECLETVGGFDPIFGLGNFEDDDWNVRARLAGFSLWIANGAFLYHAGSSTFKELGLDYMQNMERNHRLFLEKWSVGTHIEALHLTTAPPSATIKMPLEAREESSGYSMKFGNEAVDLVWRATDTEFAAAVMLYIKEQPRTTRLEILRLIDDRRSCSRCAA